MKSLQKFADIEKMMTGIRKEYHFGKLERRDLSTNPFEQLEAWLRQAVQRYHDAKANVMVLATSGKGKVSARCVLLKGLSEEGLVFYSHLRSRKARQLKENPRAAACLYWPEMERQVSVSGNVSCLTRKEAEIYFHSRPRDAQIAAWCTEQSRPIKSRAELERRFKKFAEKYKGREIPISPYWTGFCLKPREFEFWQGRANRLNDRFLYTRSESGQWNIVRLQP